MSFTPESWQCLTKTEWEALTAEEHAELARYLTGQPPAARAFYAATYTEAIIARRERT